MKVGLGHLILALAGLGSLSGLAATHVLSSSDAFTGIMSILVGGGVVAGMVVGSNNTPAPAPTPPPAPQSPPPLPPAPSLDSMFGAVSSDAWIQAASAAVVGLVALGAGGMRHWAMQVRDEIADAQADMIRVSDRARSDTQSALAVISNQVHDIFGQLDDTRQRLSRVEAIVGLAAPAYRSLPTFQPPLPEPMD